MAALVSVPCGNRYVTTKRLLFLVFHHLRLGWIAGTCGRWQALESSRYSEKSDVW